MGSLSFISSDKNRIIYDGREILLASKASYESRSVSLTPQMRCEVEHYLDNYQLFLSDEGDFNSADVFLAFSYGEGEEVNKPLAAKAVELLDQYQGTTLYAQWEIAECLEDLRPDLMGRVVSIGFDDAELYMTTSQVAQKALKQTQSNKVGVIAQSWHASRCVRHSEALGWHCQGVVTVDKFAQSDPQAWVRHPLDWILKESRMRFIEAVQTKDLKKTPQNKKPSRLKLG